TITLTREAPVGWSGHVGRVDPHVLSQLAWPPSEKPRSYVCGPTPFVEAVADALVALGHDPADVRTERFGPTGGGGHARWATGRDRRRRHPEQGVRRGDHGRNYDRRDRWGRGARGPAACLSARTGRGAAVWGLRSSADPHRARPDRGWVDLRGVQVPEVGLDSA